MQVELFEAQVSGGKKAKGRPGLRYPWWDIEEDLSEGLPGSGQLFESAPAPTVLRYGSGASAYWDLLGYVKAQAPVGVTAIELGSDSIRLAKRYAAAGGKLFVDSGAFTALTEGRVLDFEREVFPVYEALLETIEGAENVLLVMPDKIGDAAATLALQRKHAEKLCGWMDLGVEALFPIQAAGEAAVDWFNSVQEMVGGRGFAVGIPSNACAWTPEQILGFAQAVHPKRMHLLGLGKMTTVHRLAVKVSAVSPQTVLTCDSCQILAHVGQGRRLTDRTQTRLDAVVAETMAARASETPLTSFSEFWGDVHFKPGFLTREEAVALGAALGYTTTEWARKFAKSARLGTLSDLFASLDPDDEWLDDVLRNVVMRDLYEPKLRETLSGPVRAYEVARLVLGTTPEWADLKRRMDAVGWPRKAG